MKLPTVSFGPVQSLGRQDVSAPGRVAASEVRAAESWSRVSQDAVAVIGGIYEDESTLQADEDYLKYDAAMRAFMQSESEAGPYDETGKPKWESEQEMYDAADEHAREVAIGDNRTGLAKNMFASQADRASVQYRAGWDSQVGKWKVSHDKAVVAGSFDNAYQSRDWTKSWQVNEEGRITGRISEEDYIANQGKIEQGQEYYSIDDAINMAPAGQQAELVKRIEGSTILTEKNKAALTAASYKHVKEQASMSLNDRMADVMRARGEDAAVIEGQAQLDIFKGIPSSDYEKYGIQDSLHHQAIYNSMAGVWNNYNTTKVNNQEGLVRDNRVRAVMGNIVPYTPENKLVGQAYKDSYYAAHGTDAKGKGGYNDEDIFLSPETQLSGEGLQKTMGWINQTQGQYVPQELVGAVDQALRSGKPEEKVMALNVIKQYGLYPAGKRALRQAGQFGEGGEGMVANGIALMQTFDDPAMAVTMLDRRSNMTTQEVEDHQTVYDTSLKDQGDTFFQDMMKATFPADSWIPFKSSTPEVREQLRLETERRAREFAPFVDGNPASAYKMALNHMANQKYGVTSLGGRQHLMRNAPEMVVTGADKVGGEWMPIQLATDFMSAERRELPDNYDMIPIMGFNPSEPASQRYLVKWYDDDKGVMMLSTQSYSFDYSITEAAAQERVSKASDLEDARKTADLTAGDPTKIGITDWATEGVKEFLGKETTATRGHVTDIMEATGNFGGQINKVVGDAYEGVSTFIAKDIENVGKKISEGAETADRALYRQVTGKGSKSEAAQ